MKKFFAVLCLLSFFLGRDLAAYPEKKLLELQVNWVCQNFMNVSDGAYRLNAKYLRGTVRDRSWKGEKFKKSVALSIVPYFFHNTYRGYYNKMVQHVGTRGFNRYKFRCSRVHSEKYQTDQQGYPTLMLTTESKAIQQELLDYLKRQGAENIFLASSVKIRIKSKWMKNRKWVGGGYYKGTATTTRSRTRLDSMHPIMRVLAKKTPVFLKGFPYKVEIAIAEHGRNLVEWPAYLPEKKRIKLQLPASLIAAREEQTFNEELSVGEEKCAYMDKESNAIKYYCPSSSSSYTLTIWRQENAWSEEKKLVIDNLVPAGREISVSEDILKKKDKDNILADLLPRRIKLILPEKFDKIAKTIKLKADKTEAGKSDACELIQEPEIFKCLPPHAENYDVEITTTEHGEKFRATKLRPEENIIRVERFKIVIVKDQKITLRFSLPKKMPGKIKKLFSDGKWPATLESKDGVACALTRKPLIFECPAAGSYKLKLKGFEPATVTPDADNIGEVFASQLRFSVNFDKAEDDGATRFSFYFQGKPLKWKQGKLSLTLTAEDLDTELLLQGKIPNTPGLCNDKIRLTPQAVMWKTPVVLKPNDCSGKYSIVNVKSPYAHIKLHFPRHIQGLIATKDSRFKVRLFIDKKNDCKLTEKIHENQPVRFTCKHADVYTLKVSKFDGLPDLEPYNDMIIIEESQLRFPAPSIRLPSGHEGRYYLDAKRVSGASFSPMLTAKALRKPARLRAIKGRDSACDIKIPVISAQQVITQQPEIEAKAPCWLSKVTWPAYWGKTLRHSGSVICDTPAQGNRRHQMWHPKLKPTHLNVTTRLPTL